MDSFSLRLVLLLQDRTPSHCNISPRYLVYYLVLLALLFFKNLTSVSDLEGELSSGFLDFWPMSMVSLLLYQLSKTIIWHIAGGGCCWLNHFICTADVDLNHFQLWSIWFSFLPFNNTQQLILHTSDTQPLSFVIHNTTSLLVHGLFQADLPTSKLNIMPSITSKTSWYGTFTTLILYASS